MINPWTLLGVCAAWLLSLAAVGHWQNDAGHTAERVKWQAAENKDLARANGEIKRLNDEARETEQQWAAAMSQIADAYEKEGEHEKRKTDAVIADLRSGLLGLFDAAAGADTGADRAGPAGAAAGGGDGGAETRLSGAAAEFLYGEADRADAIVRQLTACQAVVLNDRLANHETTNGAAE